jgi:phasin family protein
LFAVRFAAGPRPAPGARFIHRALGRTFMANTPETPKDPETTSDVRKLMTEFDPNKLMSEFQNVLKQYKLPGVDIEALVASQKKNVEAIIAANRIAVEGIQTIAKRQAEVFQESMKEAQQAISSMTKATSPQDLAAKQTDLMKTAFEKSVATMREMAEITTRSSQEATKTINARITATLEEIRNYMTKK